MQKTVFITGSSRGIGSATAELFASKGYNVAINYLHSEREALSLEASLKEKGFSVRSFKADISCRKQVEETITKIIDCFGQIEILVNNAAITQQKVFTDISEDDWNNMINVNLKGVFYCCQSVVPIMLEKQRGKIINVSSIWGLSGASCEVHYSAAKAGVIGLTKALAKELGPSNIQVNCVAPGIIDTDMNSFLKSEEIKLLKENIPLQRLGTAKEVANCILFLASDEANYLTGQVISPNGGFLI